MMTDASNPLAIHLAAVRAHALDRFPAARRTLLVFFEELERRLADAATAPAEDETSFDALLGRLEEFLEALLIGEAQGLSRPAEAGSTPP